MECHKCQWRNNPDRLKHCLECTLDDDGKLRAGGKSVAHADASSGFMDSFGGSVDHGRARATGLPEDVEDRIVSALATFAGLDGVDALLAHHLLNGRSLASFEDALREVAAVVLRRDAATAASSPGRSRSWAWSRAAKVARSFAPFRSIVPNTGQLNKGGGKRPKRKTEYIQEELL